MRILAFIITFLCVSQLSSAQTIDGFWGVKFGSGKATAKAIIKKEKGLEPIYSNDDGIVYNPGTFGGYSCRSVALSFTDNRLSVGMVTYPSNELDIFRDYEKIREAITKKYGSSFKEKDEYAYPYKKGDDDAVSAIKYGHTNICTYWWPDPSKKFVIEVAIEKDLTVTLSYIDMSANDAELKKGESDF